MDPVFVLLGWPISLAIVGAACFAWGRYHGHLAGKVEATANHAVDLAKTAVANTVQSAANAVTGALGQSGPK